jgi:hypothetical protein
LFFRLQDLDGAVKPQGQYLSIIGWFRETLNKPVS